MNKLKIRKRKAITQTNNPKLELSQREDVKLTRREDARIQARKKKKA